MKPLYHLWTVKGWLSHCVFPSILFHWVRSGLSEQGKPLSQLPICSSVSSSFPFICCYQFNVSLGTILFGEKKIPADMMKTVRAPRSVVSVATSVRIFPESRSIILQETSLSSQPIISVLCQRRGLRSREQPFRLVLCPSLTELEKEKWRSVPLDDWSHRCWAFSVDNAL